MFPTIYKSQLLEYMTHFIFELETNRNWVFKDQRYLLAEEGLVHVIYSLHQPILLPKKDRLSKGFSGHSMIQNVIYGVRRTWAASTYIAYTPFTDLKPLIFTTEV